MKLLKLGGSVITNKRGRCEANLPNIEKLSKMLGELWASGKRDIILVHGAGSFGHALVIEKNLRGKLEKSSFANVREVQNECASLSGIIETNLRKCGIDAKRIPPHEIIESKDGRIVKLDKQPVFRLLEEGKMPILHGDMVKDSKLGFYACSGDQIIAQFSKDAEFIVLGTDVDGILINGKLAKIISDSNFEEVKVHLKESGSPDVTGGMLGKISEMKRAGGIYFVANANYPQRLSDLLSNKTAICTKLNFSFV